MGLIHADATALTIIQGSSDGVQPKYYDSSNNYWYKQNRYGYEDKSESLASLVLQFSNITKYVIYEPCLIDDIPGCCSKNFLTSGESFISFQRLYELAGSGCSLYDAIRSLDTCSERIDYVHDFLLDTIGFDCSEYLSQVLSLDALILNTDRHFNNLGIIINNETGNCKAAPIFDNGAALLSSYKDFPADTPFQDCLDKLVAHPFSTNFIEQATEAGWTLKLDYIGIKNRLLFEPSSRAVDVLYYQLEQLKDFIPQLEYPEIPFINYTLSSD